MPSVDLDATLIAIRIATYGEILELSTKVPGTGEDRKFDVDLRQMLNKLVTPVFNDDVTIAGIDVKIQPLTYREYTDSNLKTFEEQRIFSLVNDDDMDDATKLSRFTTSFKKLTDLTINMLCKSIKSITIEDTVVTNQPPSSNLSEKDTK
jgi:hypothetical protein